MNNSNCQQIKKKEMHTIGKCFLTIHFISDWQLSNWSPQRNKRQYPFMRIFSYYSCPVGKIIKFSINKTYNRKTWRVLSNQQGKNHTKVEYRESSNFVFLFPQLCKNRHSLFLPLGASIGATSCQSNQWKTRNLRIDSTKSTLVCALPLTVNTQFVWRRKGLWAYRV